MILRFEQQLVIDRESAFKFHETPANLIRLCEKWPTFQMLEHSGSIRCGAVVKVAEKAGPFRITLTLEHFIYEPPIRFADRQIKGPFKKFEHIHEFFEEDDGTKIVDRLDIQLPWWLGGELAMRLLIAPKVRRYFAFRKEAYLSHVQSGKMAEENS